MNKKTLEDFNVKGKRVFVRVDFNVPIGENGEITDETQNCCCTAYSVSFRT